MSPYPGGGGVFFSLGKKGGKQCRQVTMRKVNSSEKEKGTQLA